LALYPFFAFGWIGVIGDYKANTRDFQVGLDFVGCEFLKLHWCASPSVTSQYGPADLRGGLLEVYAV
jgi:hypothetical protein